MCSVDFLLTGTELLTTTAELISEFLVHLQRRRGQDHHRNTGTLKLMNARHRPRHMHSTCLDCLLHSGQLLLVVGDTGGQHVEEVGSLVDLNGQAVAVIPQRAPRLIKLRGKPVTL